VKARAKKARIRASSSTIKILISPRSGQYRL
jgi:hypothetical protein